LIFAAAGNEGDVLNEKEYPASTPGVIGVAGVDQNAKPVKDSQWGPQIDIAAPGKNMVRACSGGTQLCEGTGTSGATALASASAALLWSQHPDWTNNQVLRVLLQTASGNEKGLSRDDVIGYGVVRPRIALKDPGDPGPADEYPLPDFSYEGAKSPSLEASEPKPAGDKAATAAPTASSDDSGNTGLWVAAGIGAAVVLGTAIAIPVIRSRRRTAPPAPTAAAPHPYASGQPYYAQSPLLPNTAPHNQNGSNGGT
jgi:hypothetical protein